MKRKKIKWILIALATGAVGLLLEALFLEQYFFKIKTFDIGNKGNGRIIKLVLLTDLHLKNTLLPHYRKLAATLNSLQPDLILITGDTLDSTGNMECVNAFFRLIDPHLKKVAIPGNNDYKADPSLAKLEEVYNKHNCDLLLNESKAYLCQGKNITVTGLDDFIESESRFGEAVKDIGREEHHILLIHSPLQQKQAKEEIEKINKERSPADQLNIHYIFAGHTHGGQVRLPGYVPVLPRKSGGYVNGWYNDSTPYLYVSRGFGTSTLPFRFFARSEVTVFNYYV